MLSVFFEVVLPVVLVSVAGGIVGRWRKIPVGPISALAFYLLAPALVLHSMATTNLSADVSFRIVGAMLAVFVAMYIASTAWSLAVDHNQRMRAGFALAVTTPNTGNMGLPVAFLAFGQAGLDIAVLNFVIGALLANTAGVAIASMAGGSPAGALRAPFRYPALYAAIIGVVLNVTDTELPFTIWSPVETLSSAAIPIMLVVLGLQLQAAARPGQYMDTTIANAGRLLIAPVVAWFAATALGLDGVTRATLVVLSAMPTAVIATIVATEFRARPDFVTRVVVTSTLLSTLTATVLITILR